MLHAFSQALSKQQWPRSSLYLITLLTTACPALAELEAWQERFAKEAPVQWRRYMERAQGFQGIVRTTVTERGQVIYDYITALKQGGGCVLRHSHWFVQSRQPVELERLNVYTPRYSFELTRSKGRSSWTLLSVTPPSREPGLASDPRVSYRWLSRLFLTPACFEIELDGTLDQHNYVVESVASEKIQGDDLVRVFFRCDGTSSKHLLAVKGYLLFDPQHYWVIRSGEVALQIKLGDKLYRPRKQVHINYRPGGDNVPIPQALIRIHRDENAGSEILTRHEFDLSEGETPVHEFQLSYYGFPEPEELRGHKPTPWWLYILLAGLALVILSFGIYACRGHRSAAFA